MADEFKQKQADTEAIFATFNRLSAPFRQQIESLINAGALYERAERMLAQNKQTAAM